MVYNLILILSGMFLALLTSLNGQLGRYYDIFATSFFVHFIALIMLLIYIKFFEKKKISFRGTPKYVYLVGFLGVFMVSSNSWLVLNIGATTLLSISIIGQMLSSAIVDNYGWFGMKKIPFKLKELPCYLLVLIGVLIVVYS